MQHNVHSVDFCPNLLFLDQFSQVDLWKLVYPAPDLYRDFFHNHGLGHTHVHLL